MYDLGQSFRINPNTLRVDKKNIIMGKAFRIEVLSERLIRFEYSEAGRFVDGRCWLSESYSG